MPRTAAPRYVRPREACTFDHDGAPVVLSPNEIFEKDDPVVKARPELFIPLEPSRQRPAVEQATAGPGEQRPVKA